MDGFTELRRMRERGDKTPIMMLTARGETRDRIEGFDSGADDYLPKPFEMGELLARVRAMLRRREAYTPDLLQFGEVSLDRGSFELSANGQSMVLPNLEYRLMEQLMLNQGIYQTSEQLLVQVWGYDTEAEIGTVWVYLSYLRKRLQALDAKVQIRAKRNVGYRLEVLP